MSYKVNDVLRVYYSCNLCHKFLQHHERSFLVTLEGSALICVDCAKVFAVPAAVKLYDGVFKTEHKKNCKKTSCKICKRK